MIDPASFFKALGLFSLIIALVGGFCYWVTVAIKKNFPNLKYQIKYKLLRKKFDKEIVFGFMEDIEAGVDEKELIRAMWIKSTQTNTDPKEMMYIYDQVKRKMKGGIKHE